MIGWQEGESRNVSRSPECILCVLLSQIRSEFASMFQPRWSLLVGEVLTKSKQFVLVMGEVTGGTEYQSSGSVVELCCGWVGGGGGGGGGVGRGEGSEGSQPWPNVSPTLFEMQEAGGSLAHPYLPPSLSPPGAQCSACPRVPGCCVAWAGCSCFLTPSPPHTRTHKHQTHTYTYTHTTHSHTSRILTRQLICRCALWSILWPVRPWMSRVLVLIRNHLNQITTRRISMLDHSL